MQTMETGNYYYGARYYDPKVSVWLSVDPMASERSWLTPYNFVQNNPLMRVDPNGMLDGEPLNYGAGFRLTFPSSGKPYASAFIGVGGTYRSGNAAVSFNASLNVYNGGLGSVGGKWNMDASLTGIASFGVGQGKSLPLSGFNSMSFVGAIDDFKHSLSSGQTLSFNGKLGFHRVASTRLKSGDFSAMIYNDVQEPKALLFGGKTDEAWTGGGIGRIALGNGGRLDFGTEVFTGMRPDNINETFNLNGTNYYDQSAGNSSYNSGQTFFGYAGANGLGSRINLRGKAHMFSQDLIHGTNTPHFRSFQPNLIEAW